LSAIDCDRAIWCSQKAAIPTSWGGGTVWNEELPLCVHQNHIFRVRIADSERLHPAYLSRYMSGRAARAFFLRSAKQTTGIASINMTQLRGLPVVVAPMQRQLEFVEGAEAVCRLTR
jgi:type I restriction enzyme S subunit